MILDACHNVIVCALYYFIDVILIKIFMITTIVLLKIFNDQSSD